MPKDRNVYFILLAKIIVDIEYSKVMVFRFTKNYEE
jgi:hypothetical protein